MFTGLIADLGRVEAVERDADGATLRISSALAPELGEGDSISVNGVCLTAVDVLVGDPAARVGARALARGGVPGGAPEGELEAAGAETAETAADDVALGGFAAQAMHETLQRSALAALQVGDPVNLELALRADGRLGGHIVQGHVDGVATLTDVREDGFSHVLTLSLDPALLPYIVEKGSIALNGVSLTVSALRHDGLEVSLIPETLQRTTLGRAAAGERVNVEVDILAKHVQRLLAAQQLDAHPAT
ncbi:MAG TPA: riboflavin synthase [Solirubrobacteraceae bacterium]